MAEISNDQPYSQDAVPDPINSNPIPIKQTMKDRSPLISLNQYDNRSLNPLRIQSMKKIYHFVTIKTTNQYAKKIKKAIKFKNDKLRK